ncbi:bacteriocin microcin [Erwinia aphidicola]|uniref:Bacteriocin microcin n=1 Tax=Erwinia aphidicola TaxID=68334 RepID=A0ABU8DGM3_ERWAP
MNKNIAGENEFGTIISTDVIRISRQSPLANIGMGLGGGGHCGGSGGACGGCSNGCSGGNGGSGGSGPVKAAPAFQ